MKYLSASTSTGFALLATYMALSGPIVQTSAAQWQWNLAVASLVAISVGTALHFVDLAIKEIKAK